MPDISQSSVADVMMTLPELVPLERALADSRGFDALITCAGFEDRATAVMDDLAGSRIEHALIIDYPTNAQDNAPARTKLEKLPATATPERIEYNRFDFLCRIRDWLRPYEDRDPMRVVVDVSGMASYVVYRVLSAIWETLPLARLGVYYAEAAEYSPSESEWTEFYKGVSEPGDNLVMAERYEQTHFQSKGVDFTYDSDVFPGQNAGALATELVAVPSFSLLRMKAMIAHAESNYSVPDGNVRWFLGQPPDRVKNGWRFDALAKLYNVRRGGEAVSTRDYREIFQKLDAVWEETFTERHLVIASQGSKMQHLGTFLFLTMHRECGQILSEPQEFISSRYTRGVGPKWWIDFGTIDSVRQALASRGNLVYRW